LFYLHHPINNDRIYVRGHVISKDLVHWKDLPMLAFHGGTGQICVDKDRVIMTSAGSALMAASGVSLLTTASDRLLLDWKGHKKNNMPRRDKCIWKEDDYYYLGVQSGGGVALHRSNDLASWEPAGFLFQDNGYYANPGDDCSCPNFLPLSDGKHILLSFSHKSSSQYFVGSAPGSDGR